MIRATPRILSWDSSHSGCGARHLAELSAYSRRKLLNGESCCLPAAAAPRRRQGILNCDVSIRSFQATSFEVLVSL